MICGNVFGRESAVVYIGETSIRLIITDDSICAASTPLKLFLAFLAWGDPDRSPAAAAETQPLTYARHQAPAIQEYKTYNFPLGIPSFANSYKENPQRIHNEEIRLWQEIWRWQRSVVE
jgi:hypothetical protein